MRSLMSCCNDLFCVELYLNDSHPGKPFLLVIDTFDCIDNKEIDILTYREAESTYYYYLSYLHNKYNIE